MRRFDLPSKQGVVDGEGDGKGNGDNPLGCRRIDCHRLGLSVYDAAYLELAARLQVPLACKDGPLREAARQIRVRVVP
jgi:hypothetical protein